MPKVQKMVTTSRPKTILYSALGLTVVCCFVLFIAKLTGSSLQTCLLSHQIYDQENLVDGEHGSLDHSKELEGYYSRLCKLDR